MTLLEIFKEAWHNLMDNKTLLGKILIGFPLLVVGTLAGLIVVVCFFIASPLFILLKKYEERDRKTPKFWIRFKSIFYKEEKNEA